VSAHGATAPTQALLNAWAPQGGVTGVFSNKVADYVASRPDYPAAVFSVLAQRLAKLGVAPADAVVADLGAGTGLFTAGLLQLAAEVIAVEPNGPMRAAADAWLGNAPGYRSVAGTAENTGLASASVHLLTAAQCAHWWDMPRARLECQRVLVPGGLAALVWNDRVADDGLQRDLNALFGGFGGEHRTAMVADEAVRDAVAAALFGGPHEQMDMPHAHTLDLAGLQALVFSRSYMPARDSVEGATAAQAVADLFQAHAEQGEVVMRYVTRAWVGSLA
jgi:SAM-dependent methyltransferase